MTITKFILQPFRTDVLVEPTYQIVTARGASTVTVTGFPASYKNSGT